MARRASKSNIDVVISIDDRFSAGWKKIIQNTQREMGRLQSSSAGGKGGLGQTQKQVQALLTAVNNLVSSAHAAGATVQGALTVGGQKAKKDLEDATKSAKKLQNTLRTIPQTPTGGRGFRGFMGAVGGVPSQWQRPRRTGFRSTGRAGGFEGYLGSPMARAGMRAWNMPDPNMRWGFTGADKNAQKQQAKYTAEASVKAAEDAARRFRGRLARQDWDAAIAGGRAARDRWRAQQSELRLGRRGLDTMAGAVKMRQAVAQGMKDAMKPDASQAEALRRMTFDRNTQLNLQRQADMSARIAADRAARTEQMRRARILGRATQGRAAREMWRTEQRRIRSERRITEGFAAPEVMQRMTAGHQVARVSALAALSPQARMLKVAFAGLGTSIENTRKKYPKLDTAMEKTGTAFRKIAEKIRYTTGPEGQRIKRDYTGRLESLRNFGFTLSAATMPLQMFAQQATHLQRDFIGNLNFIASVTEGTAEAMREVQETALHLGRTKPYTSSQVAGAMANLALSGLTIPETTGLIGTVLDLASAGRTGVEFAGQSAAAAMRATGRTPQEMQKVADIYAKTQASTSATVRDLSISSRQILGLASAAGHSTEELFAIIGLLRNLGQIPSTIGVYMRQILSFMARGRIQKDLRRMGVDVQGSRKSFLTLVKELERVNADADKIMEIFLGPSGSLLNLLMNIGSTRIEELVTQLKESDGFAKKVAARQESGIYGAYRRMASAREGMMHAAMEGLMGQALEWWAETRFNIYSGAAGSGFWSNVIGAGTLIGNIAGGGLTYASQAGLAALGLGPVAKGLWKGGGALVSWIGQLGAARVATDSLTASQRRLGTQTMVTSAQTIGATRASTTVVQNNLRGTAATAAAAGAAGRAAWLSLAGPLGWILAAAGIAATGFGIYKLWQAGADTGAPTTQALTGAGNVSQITAGGATAGLPGGMVDVNVNLTDPGDLVQSVEAETEGQGMTTSVKMDKGFAGAVA